MQVHDPVVMGSLAFALGSADSICPAVLILPHPTLRTKTKVWIASGPTVVRASSRFYRTLFFSCVVAVSRDACHGFLFVDTTGGGRGVCFCGIVAPGEGMIIASTWMMHELYWHQVTQIIFDWWR